MSSARRPLDTDGPKPIIPAVKKLPLLVEIGTEEIPPSFLKRATGRLYTGVGELLADNQVNVGGWHTFWTPRRLVVKFDSVDAEVAARKFELQGPPAKIAFDAEGRPTKAGAGFCKANGADPAGLYRRRNDKGEYAFIEKQLPAVSTADILKEGLPGVVRSIHFPKTMRWLPDDTRFARPVRWLVCLLGDEPVEFEFAGLKAGRTTMGHRGTEKPVELRNPAEYEAALEKARVLVSPERRKTAVVDGLKKLALGVKGEPVPDDELADETVNITESPTPVLCRFDPGHLELPAEVLVTALKKHQRCFAVQSEDGRLLPYFITVADTPACDRKQVAKWVESAVESRLRDARFFFEQDMKKGLAALVEDEKRVSWFEEMGTYFDKTERMRALCRAMANAVPEADADTLDRAAQLSKADLLTQMIREKEFTSLQGRMGGTYAGLQGEPEPVAKAIAEQYLPRFAGDTIPGSIEGALLSIADRVDNIVAGFLAGAIPTGSEDPYALRRQAWGMLVIALEQGLAVEFGDLLDAAVKLFDRDEPEHAAKLPGFVRERLQAVLTERGVRYDVADAVLETDWHRPNRALAAAQALGEFREKPGFEKLIIGQKRVANILRDQDVEGEPDEKLFAEEAEKELFGQASELAPRIRGLAAKGEFGPALDSLLSLRPAIDRLFDDVLVMDKDEAVRQNRLRLLLYVRSLFRQVADLSRIVIEGENQD